MIQSHYEFLLCYETIQRRLLLLIEIVQTGTFIVQQQSAPDPDAIQGLTLDNVDMHTTTLSNLS